HFERRISVLLDREPGCNYRRGAIAKVEQHLGGVLGFDADLAAVHFSFWNHHTRQAQHAFRRSEQTRQARDAVYPEIEQGAATWFVKPFVPGRTGPAITGPGQAGLADIPPRDALPHRLKRGAKDAKRGADQM